MYHGFALKVEVPKGLAILECITPEIFSKGRQLARSALMTLCSSKNKCLKMYLELHDNPPFPAWRSTSGRLLPQGRKKDGLDEVWN